MIPLHRQIQAVEREIKRRKRTYPNRTMTGRMSQTEAFDELAAMEAVLETLKMIAEGLAEKEKLL